MPCPYFLPLDRLEAGISARFPLVDPYRGECHAGATAHTPGQATAHTPDEATAHTPDEATLLSLCNMGYARGRCSHFPAGDGPDAVRFAAGPADAVRYAREQNHFPFDAGEVSESDGGILQAQVRAFRRSYYRRPGRAGGDP